MSWIDNATSGNRRAHCIHSCARDRNWRTGVSRNADDFPVVLGEIIDPEFFVVIERQFADDRAQGDLRRFYVHLVQNLLDFDHDFLIAEHDDRVRALIGDDLGITDHNCFRRCVDRLSREFFGNVKRSAAAGPTQARAGRRCRCCREAAAGRGRGCRPARLTRARSRLGSTAFRTRARLLPRLAQRLHDYRQHIRRRNVIERAGDRFGEFHIGIELGNKFANKRHIDRAGDDVDPIRAHVG